MATVPPAATFALWPRLALGYQWESASTNLGGISGGGSTGVFETSVTIPVVFVPVPHLFVGVRGTSFAPRPRMTSKPAGTHLFSRRRCRGAVFVAAALVLFGPLSGRALPRPSSLEVGGGRGVSWIDAVDLHLRLAIEPVNHLQIGVRGLYEGWFWNDQDGNRLSQWAVAGEARWLPASFGPLTPFIEGGAGIGQVITAGCGDEYACFQGGLTPYARLALGMELGLGRFFASLAGEAGLWRFMHETVADEVTSGPTTPGPDAGTFEITLGVVASLGIRFGEVHRPSRAQ